MAAVPYDGVPSVAPSGNLPDNYIRVQDKTSASVQRLGAGLVDAGNAFTQASSDNAFNLYQKDVTSILRGTPAPEGGQNDPGYLGLNGRAALDARPTVEKQIADLRKKYLSDLGTNPIAQNAFDKQAGQFETSSFATVSSHADDQSKVWMTNVNKASEDNALARIAASPLDAAAYNSGTADLINARVKQAQIIGAQPGDAVYTAAVNEGRRDALRARVLAIGTDDPSRALKFLQRPENQKIAGASYDEIYTALRGRADEQDGYGAADAALKAAADQHATGSTYTNPSLPIYQETAANLPGGMSAAGLARTVQIESSGDPTIANASGHVGLGQFSEETAKSVGITDRTDPEQSIVGIQRLAAQNARALTKALGRPPTDAELYLAHQQGGGGASKLLRNPDAPAASIVGLKAVLQNGGTQDMTSAQYVAMWTHKFTGTANVGHADNQLAPSLLSAPQVQQPAVPDMQPPAAPAGPDQASTAPPVAPSGVQPPNLGFAQVKADAMQAVLDDPNLTPRARAIAITRVNQQYAAMAAAEQQTASAKKAASDQASDQYVTKILTNDTAGLAETIARDPNLDGDKKIALTNALLAHADQSATAAAAAYGPGFWGAYQQVSAPVGDASRIADMGDLLRRAGPGGDLTLAGVQKLSSIMTLNAKSVDQASVNSAKMGLMNYAKAKLSNQSDPNPALNDPGHKDPIGEAAFQGTFIPKFEAAFDAWVKGGKDPWEFLTTAKADEMMQGIRDPQQVAMQKILGGIPEYAGPAAPAGVDEKAWQGIVQHVPASFIGQNGQPTIDWPGILNVLVSSPTPTTMHYFDQKYGKGNGFTAKDVLDALGIEPGAAPAGPAGAPPDAPEPNPDYPGAHAVVNGVEDLGLPMPGG